MNNRCKFLIILFLIFTIANLNVQAEKYKGSIVKKSPKASADCYPPAKNTNLALNNVRAYLKTNGTMWFDESRAQYEVPKGSGKTSLFSSSLWIGGRNLPHGNGVLYFAGMRFGQIGNDFWTGPLQVQDFSIEPGSCSYYDKFYTMTRVEVERHILAFIENDAAYMANIPKSILEWPAHGRAGESRYLAPFFKVGEGDVNTYEPELGDYPYYDLDNELCPWTPINIEKAKKCPWINEFEECDNFSATENTAGLPLPRERVDTKINYGTDNKMIYADHVLKGDETVFWFLNDRGAPHTETSCPNSIGLEIRAQAFAFATNNELNKMTFYSYEIINRGNITLYDTYFSQWCDPDLGWADDDYVGCDVIRGLGYCYNGTEYDGIGQLWAYGENPPAVGLDFFQGPYIDADGADNPHFRKELANINGNPEEIEYCKRYVQHIFDNPDIFNINDDNLLDKFLVLDKFFGDTVIKDTVRWNDQFAINGVNFGDGIVDNERFGMRAFTYHDNETGPKGDPRNYTEYYNYLTGKWTNAQPFVYGGDGFQGSDILCNFVFPKGTDYCNWGTSGINPGEQYNNGGKTGNWTEKTPDGNIQGQPNKPKDRRFMQSAGPFTLRQGACNYITVGVPWARALQGGVEASLTLLMVADDKCQALFENCFKILDGPDAPNVTIREYDQKLILLLTNSPLSNNKNEDYIEADNLIPENRYDITTHLDTIGMGKDTVLVSYITDTITYDRNYRFEGYQIFQVTGPEVGAIDLENPDLARLIRQYDIVNFDEKGNPIGRLINWEFSEELQLDVPKEMVAGGNIGIQHSFEVTQDAFATGNTQLVNYKTYYFIAVAYAYNEYWPYSTDPTIDPYGVHGQKFPYLRGRKTAEGKSVTPVAAIPHPPTVHGGGATLYSDYGSIPYITRIDGQGNGGIALDLMPETIDKIINGGDKGDYRVRELNYDKNAGPLNIKVIDPLRVKPLDFTLIIKDTIYNSKYVKESVKNKTDVTNDAFWVLTIDNVTDEELIEIGLVDAKGLPIREFISQTSIGQSYEQIIMPLGISVNIYNTDFAAKDPKINKYMDRLLTIGYRHDVFRIKQQFFQTEKIDVNNDIIFENNGPQWITGLIDDNVNLPSNWIRSGSYNLGPWTGNSQTVSGDFELERLEDFHYPSKYLVGQGRDTPPEDRGFKDYLGGFGTVCGGTWAPYVLSSPYDNGPQAKYTAPEPILTSDASGKLTYREPSYDATSSDDQKGLNNYYNFKGLSHFRAQPGYNQTMTNLYSINVVLTSDQSKWTRCIVLEACQDRTKSEGGALKHEPRKHTSVKKDGSPDYDSKDGFGIDGTEGMGWFPGYAINIETGERLNIMFAENSDEELNAFPSRVNGRDMLFNPTSTYAITKYDLDLDMGGYVIPAGTPISKQEYDALYEAFNPKVLYEGLGIERVWGGMHYVYVCNSTGNTSSMHYISAELSGILIDTAFLRMGRRNFNLRDTVISMNHGGAFSNPLWIDWGGYLDNEHKYPVYDCGPYDEGKWLVQKFKQVLAFPETNTNEGADIIQRKFNKMQLFNNVMYTHIPMLPDDETLQKQWMSCDVTYKIRVTRPYMRYISRWYESPELRDMAYSVPDEYEQYKGYPVYKLSTKGLEPTFNDSRLYQSILDNINIVPNPYYCASLYEGNTLQTVVKIINLPTDLKNNSPVTINIYTVSGILVRTLTKGDSETSYVNWDLKNYANIPIASGVYIIHVNCPGIGERMLKFFCTMRQTDLNTF